MPIRKKWRCARHRSSPSGQSYSGSGGGFHPIFRHRGLRRRETRDRHAIGRARDIVEPDLLAETDRSGVAAMLAADAELQVATRLAAAREGNSDQLADAVAVDGDERIVLEDAGFLVGPEKTAAVVARQTQRGLGQIVGAEAEEFGGFGDLAGAQRGARQLDHRADRIRNLTAGVFADLGGDAVYRRLDEI